MQRRTCIKTAAFLLGPGFFTQRSTAESVLYSGVDPQLAGLGFWDYPRWVWLKRPASGETIRLEYWRDGVMNRQAYQAISWFLRDVRFDSMLRKKDPAIRRALDRGQIGAEHLSPWTWMDPILLDILYAYCAWLNFHGVVKPLTVTSGLRHILTNAMTEGAAKDSWHTRGGAADILIDGVPVDRMASFGRWLSGGGVGLYIHKGFVHVDKGRVRSWRG